MLYEVITDRITGGEHKVASTFVPGNLNELLMCFDIVNNLPEINAIQNAMRKKSGDMIMEAERAGHSEDVCTYVKADIGIVITSYSIHYTKLYDPPTRRS